MLQLNSTYLIFKKIIIILLFLNLQVTLAGAPNNHIQNNLHINSHKLILDKIKNIAYFEGEVILFYQDITLYTHKLHIIYKPGPKTEIDQIIIPEQLKVIKEKKNEVLTANSGKFFVDEGKLILTGDVLLMQQNNILKTKQLVYYTIIKKN